MQKNFQKQLAKHAWLAILGPMKATFTLKNSIHGITETFIVLENSVIIECSVNFGGTIQQAVEVTLEEARMHWKEYTANGWVRI